MEQSTILQKSSIFPSNITNSLPSDFIKLINTPQFFKCHTLSCDKSNELKKNLEIALDLSCNSLVKNINLSSQNQLKLIKTPKYFEEPISLEQILKLEQIDNKISNKFMQESNTSIVLKPPHSYIGLIAMAILNSTKQQKTLSEIYEWIIENYPYFKWRGTGWRNSIRHNLSLNDCFIKSIRASNGKGHYWAIHPVFF